MDRRAGGPAVYAGSHASEDDEAFAIHLSINVVGEDGDSAARAESGRPEGSTSVALPVVCC